MNKSGYGEKVGIWELHNYGLVKVDWGLVINKYKTICIKLLTIRAVTSKTIFCASLALNLWFVKACLHYFLSIFYFLTK